MSSVAAPSDPLFMLQCRPSMSFALALRFKSSIHPFALPTTMNFPASDPLQGKAPATAASPPHVVLLAFPAQGHISPCLSIADCLAANGILVTLVHALDGFVPQGPPPIHQQTRNSFIRNRTIPSGADHSQPFSGKKLRDCIDAMGKSFAQLLQKLMQEDNPPVCILLDSSFGWGGGVAEEFGLFQVVIWTGPAYVLCLGTHLPDFVERGLIPATAKGDLDAVVDFIPGLSPFRLGDMMPKVLLASEGLQSDFNLFMSAAFDNIKRADRILVNTLYELESSALDGLRTGLHLHVDPVGPLHMMNTSTECSASLNEGDRSCLQWLDQQQESSVLYISFGSVAALEEHAFAELAHALEASGERFLWVIRRDAYEDKSSVEEILPEGFMDRIRGRGLVISWAPQLVVLGHPSVSAFLTHCGWNSVLESLSNGVPMLGFAQRAEQATTLRLIVDVWKVGLPLLSKQKIDRKSVQDAVTAIMKGQLLRTRARQWKDIAFRAVHGSSKNSFLRFVADLKQGTVNHHQQWSTEVSENLGRNAGPSGPEIVRADNSL